MTIIVGNYDAHKCTHNRLFADDTNWIHHCPDIPVLSSSDILSEEVFANIEQRNSQCHVGGLEGHPSASSPVQPPQSFSSVYLCHPIQHT
mmetsp:Transcript_5506/g.9474  ORF Transcript_5506/g.9474 Transcript_5506/m.9474 type:complete len:90 (-) Transcript_5506:832-1101(-)